MRAEGTDLERLNRFFQVIDGAGRRGEMQNVIERTLDVDVIGDIVLDEAESAPAQQVLDVGGTSGDEIIHADDFMTALQEQFAEMGAEKAGPACDQRARH